MRRLYLVLVGVLVLGALGCNGVKGDQENVVLWELAGKILVPLLAAGMVCLIERYRWAWNVLKIMVDAIESVEPPGAENKIVSHKVRNISIGMGRAKEVNRVVQKAKKMKGKVKRPWIVPVILLGMMFTGGCATSPDVIERQLGKIEESAFEAGHVYALARSLAGDPLDDLVRDVESLSVGAAAVLKGDIVPAEHREIYYQVIDDLFNQFEEGSDERRYLDLVFDVAAVLAPEKEKLAAGSFMDGFTRGMRKYVEENEP